MEFYRFSFAFLLGNVLHCCECSNTRYITSSGFKRAVAEKKISIPDGFSRAELEMVVWDHVEHLKRFLEQLNVDAVRICSESFLISEVVPLIEKYVICLNILPYI